MSDCEPETSKRERTKDEGRKCDQGKGTKKDGRDGRYAFGPATGGVSMRRLVEDNTGGRGVAFVGKERAMNACRNDSGYDWEGDHSMKPRMDESGDHEGGKEVKNACLALSSRPIWNDDGGISLSSFIYGLSGGFLSVFRSYDRLPFSSRHRSSLDKHSHTPLNSY